jgi:cell division septation protein DedD
VQVAALVERGNASLLVSDLRAAGLPAYIVSSPESEPGPYRIRVGPYPTRAAAGAAVPTLERMSGRKLWVVREQ